MKRIHEEIDILIMCSTNDLEWKTLEIVFDDYFQNIYYEKSDERRYYFTEISNNDKTRFVNIAFTLIESMEKENMGRVPAAIAMRDIMHTFYKVPKYVILTGIAAAKPMSKYKIGNIVVSLEVVDYAEQRHEDDMEEYKRQKRKFKGGDEIPTKVTYRTKNYPCSSFLVNLAREIEGTDWHKEFNKALRDAAQRSLEEKGMWNWPPKCHYEAIASGDFLVDNKIKATEIFEELSKNKKLKVGILEMEAGGIGSALQTAWCREYPKFIVIKGISDFAYNKTNDLQTFACYSSMFFVRHLVEKYANYHADKISRIKSEIIAEIGPNENTLNLINRFTPNYAEVFRKKMIDGAIEIISCPNVHGPYDGLQRNNLHCEISDSEWPDNCHFDNVQKTLSGLAKGLIGDKKNDIEGWYQKTKQKAYPGRIRFLLEPINQPTLDNPELTVKLGNSDYFTMKAIQESFRMHRDKKNNFDHIFANLWSTSENKFNNDCVPHHVSAQGIFVCKDTKSKNEYLIIARTSPLTDTPYKGWEVTMSEQMKAAQSRTSYSCWWEEFLKESNFDYTKRGSKTGDIHIQDTLFRGIKEEFDLNKNDVSKDPPLLNITLEEDTFFLAFVFFVSFKLNLIEEFYERWKSKIPHDAAELGVLAAYPIGGLDKDKSEIDGARKIAELLNQEYFDYGPYLLPEPSSTADRYPWLPSSRMRIYLLGMHLYGNQFGKYVKIRETAK